MRPRRLEALRTMLSRDSGAMRDSELDCDSRHWLAMAGILTWAGGEWFFISNFGRRFVEDDMSVQVTEGNPATIYCSCTGWSLGPIFEGSDPELEAINFLSWINVDARHLDAELLRRAKDIWHRTHMDERGRELRLCPISDEESMALLRELQQADHEWMRRMAQDAYRRQATVMAHAAVNAGVRE